MKIKKINLAVVMLILILFVQANMASVSLAKSGVSSNLDQKLEVASDTQKISMTSRVSTVTGASLFQENFDDGDITASPAWVANNNAFAILGGVLNSDGLIIDQSDRYWNGYSTSVNISASDYLEFSYKGSLKSLGNPQTGRGVQLVLASNSTDLNYSLNIQRGYTNGFPTNKYSLSLTVGTTNTINDLIITSFQPNYDQVYVVKAVRSGGLWSLYVDGVLIGTTPDARTFNQIDAIVLYTTGSITIDDLRVGVQMAGFHLNGRNLVDANGNNFVMRGVNYPHAFFPDKVESSFAHIKATGANTVRVVLSNGLYTQWVKDEKSPNGRDEIFVETPAADVKAIINLCSQHHLVCVLEVHDTTGYLDYDDMTGDIVYGKYYHTRSSTLFEAVGYWKKIQPILNGTENFVIINIGNEPYGHVDIGGNAFGVKGWVKDTKNAIAEMRNAGFQHMLMVDAPNWGGDDDDFMTSEAAAIFASDQNKNTVFSVHMYGRFNESVAEGYVDYFANIAKLPLVIGEFGWEAPYGDPDEDTIMSIAQSYGVGYLGWSWSGNNESNKYLDMIINFDPNERTWWGNRLIGGENGICRTAQEASFFGGGNDSIVCSSTRTNLNPTNLANVNFTVAFSEAVDNVDANDFTLIQTGILNGAKVDNVIGSGAIYTVTVSTGTGNGTIRLEVPSTATITTLDGNGLSALPFTSGERYSVRTMAFTDVSNVYWSWQYIERLFNAGITGGCATGTYCPENEVTRAQMAVFLEKGLHYPSTFTPPNVTPTFNDTVGHWAEDWIEALKSDGITSGCGTGLYCPDNPVTRAQMAVFLLKSKHGVSYAPPPATGVFTDVPVGYWADKWIEQLALEGITGGCATGRYCPDDPVTRAQMAVFLVKTFNLP